VIAFVHRLIEKGAVLPSVEQERDRTVFCELENPHQPVAVWSSPLHIDHLPECVHGEKTSPVTLAPNEAGVMLLASSATQFHAWLHESP
jgi:hypothetical protein